MKKLFFLSILLFIVAGLTKTWAQSDYVGDDCDQLQMVLDDAEIDFEGYEGEEISDNGGEATYEYNLSLWNDESRNIYFEYLEEGFLCVEYFYKSTYDFSEAKDFFADMLRKVKNCMPANYVESADHSEYYIEYFRFSEEKDASKLFPLYPEIEVVVDKDNADFYYVMVSVTAPF